MSLWLVFTLGFCTGTVAVFGALFLASLCLSRPAPDPDSVGPHAAERAHV